MTHTVNSLQVNITNRGLHAIYFTLEHRRAKIVERLQELKACGQRASATLRRRYRQIKKAQHQVQEEQLARDRLDTLGRIGKSSLLVIYAIIQERLYLPSLPLLGDGDVQELKQALREVEEEMLTSLDKLRRYYPHINKLCSYRWETRRSPRLAEKEQQMSFGDFYCKCIGFKK